MLLSSGDKIGQYEILAPIGAGGMGEVYRAKDLRLGREVAVKVLPAGMAHNDDRLARFQREARAVAALNHPHIVTIFSVEEAGGVHFLTMELVDGQAARQADSRERPPHRANCRDCAARSLTLLLLRTRRESCIAT